MAETTKATKEEALYAHLNNIGVTIGAKLDAERPPWSPRNHLQNNWASEVHHPCLKQLVHLRVDWEERKGADIGGRWRTEEGNDKEWFVKKWLGDVGYELTESQKRYSTDDSGMEKYKHLHISGKIDGLCPLKKKLPVPYSQLKEVKTEVKTVGPYFWDSTQTIEEIKKHSKFWIQKIPSQLNCYLKMSNDPGGFLIIATFGKKPRILPMLFDQELWDYDTRIIKKVNAHVKAGTYPPPIPFDPTICGMCGFNHICSPLKSTDIIEIAEVDELVLQEYLELKEKVAEFNKLKKELIGDKDSPGIYFGKNGFVGDVEINTKISERSKFSGIPKDVKEPYRERYSLTQTTIERICKEK